MQVDGFLSVIRRASIFDIFLVSFFILPFVANQWLGIVEKMDWPKGLSMVLLLLAYVLGVVLMFIGATRSGRYETAKVAIITYLEAKDFEMMGYDRIRERINASYDDAFLDSLPGRFPGELRPARLEGGKAGIARKIAQD